MRHPATRVPSWPGPAPTPLSRQRRVATAVVSLTVIAVLAGCGSGTSDSGNARASSSAPAPGFPVTVTNCGLTTTYRHPPQRAVAINRTAIVNMLALGLADRMIGMAFLPDSVPPKYREDYRRVPELAEQYPSYEVLLKTSPDFVYVGHYKAFSKGGLSRHRLREAGIQTHLNVTSCTAGQTVTMKQVWQELRTIAAIFNVESRAQALIKNLKADLAPLKRKLAGVEPASVFVYDSGTKAPFSAGGQGVANEIIRLSGGRNIFAGLDKDWLDVSWEQVIQRRPEWIVIVNYGDISIQQKKQTLLNNPALANVPAIKNRRFVVLSLDSLTTGVRAPRTVTKLARQLHPGQFQ